MTDITHVLLEQVARPYRSLYKNVFSYRMCSRIECVLPEQVACPYRISYYRTCSLTIECVLSP